jgi:hypothetical protein
MHAEIGLFVTRKSQERDGDRTFARSFNKGAGHVIGSQRRCAPGLNGQEECICHMRRTLRRGRVAGNGPIWISHMNCTRKMATKEVDRLEILRQFATYEEKSL